MLVVIVGGFNIYFLKISVKCDTKVQGKELNDEVYLQFLSLTAISSFIHPYKRACGCYCGANKN